MYEVCLYCSRVRRSPTYHKPDSNHDLIVCCAASATTRPTSATARPASATARPVSATTRAAFGAAARSSREAEADAGAEDVIDLGAPATPRRVRRAPCVRAERAARSRIPYTPNPRLYPGPTSRLKPKTRVKGESGGKLQARRRKRVFQRPVPNARLYRPAPPRPPPPPAWPRAPWPPPAAPAPRALDTASRAALRLSERRPAPAPSPPSPPAPAPVAGPRSRHLVVTLPAAAAAGGDAPQPRTRTRTQPRPKLSPARRRFVMDAANRHSTSPEDCSDGNDTLSAPSEFLAEFLSAIMQRQYAEALKYCRLILQYEPHNATARGFYPLLQNKLQAHKRQEEPVAGAAATAATAATAAGRSRWLRRGSSSEEASPHAHSHAHAHEVMGPGAAGAAGEEMQQGDDSDSDSERSECGSQSSLELDSDAPPAPVTTPAPGPATRSDRDHSLDLSRRTDHTDSASGSSGTSSGTSGASGGRWDTSGSASRSDADADADDNGNALGSGAPRTPHTLHSARGRGAAGVDADADADEGDVENDNASASLRRLRAQFACSIK